MRNIKTANHQNVQLSIFEDEKEISIAPMVKKHPSNRVVGELYFDEYAGTFQLNKEKLREFVNEVRKNKSFVFYPRKEKQLNY